MQLTILHIGESASRNGTYLLLQKRHTAENDQELINIFEHRIYTHFIYIYDLIIIPHHISQYNLLQGLLARNIQSLCIMDLWECRMQV